MRQLTQGLLKELLHYDPEAGVFTWRPRSRKHFNLDRIWKTFNSTFANKRAGNVDHNGYNNIKILCKQYRTHRLAWLYVHGHFPEQETDHINGMRNDNRMCNLRAVSKQENQRNIRVKSNTKSGVIGVCWDISCKKWKAQISGDDRVLHLGVFSDFFEAICARKSAEKRLGYHPNHGRSA